MAHVPSRPTGLGRKTYNTPPSVFEGAFDSLIETLDQVAPDVRGQIVHQFMLRNDYFDNPAQARALYKTVPEIDTYLDQVNISNAMDSEPNRGLTGEQVLATAIGFGLGFGVAYLTGLSSAPSGYSSPKLEGR